MTVIAANQYERTPMIQNFLAVDYRDSKALKESTFTFDRPGLQ